MNILKCKRCGNIFAHERLQEGIDINILCYPCKFEEDLENDSFQQYLLPETLGYPTFENY